ncbi:MAG: hypothetical protein EBV42_06100 [Actinobacteria bacterium]|nr:hypothetical protein [Actinomycetota bacterium]
MLLLYVLSHAFLVLSWNALFWDDWMIYSRGPEFAQHFFATCERCGIPLRGQYEAHLLAAGPWLMHLLVFLMWPVCGLLLERILTSLEIWPREIIRTVAAAFVLTPAYGARIALINFQYTQALLLFLLGIWLILHRQRVAQIIGLIFLFWSLFVPSFQVFMVATILIVAIKNRHALFNSPQRIVPGLLILIAFPLLHRYAIPNLYPSLKVVDGYNTIRPTFLMRALLVSVLLFIPAMWMAVTVRHGKRLGLAYQLFASGSALLALGSFAYLAVGHFPNLSDWILPFLSDQSDWNSRHQLLQTVGFAILAAALIEMFPMHRARATAAVLLISISLNIAIYSSYYLDSMKQEAFIAEITRIREVFRDGDAVIINDLARDFNARGRGIRAYEWEAMIRQATGLDITADAEALTFCVEEKPRYEITILPTSGRLKALLANSVRLQVSLTELSMCAT